MRTGRPHLFLAALGLLTFGVVVVLRTPRDTAEERLIAAAASATIDDTSRLRMQGLVAGRQLAALYFGGSRCLRCADGDLRLAIGSLRSVLAASSAPRFAHVSVVGIAINVDIREGLTFLDAFGTNAFDEVSTGRGWANDFARRYLWADSTRAVTVPRLVLVSRMLGARLDPMELTFSGDTVLAVFAGSQAITEWIAAGAPVPRQSTK